MNHFTTSQLKAAMALQGGGSYNEALLSKDVKSIESLYHDDGYLQARVDSFHIETESSANEVSLTAYIYEGKPSIVYSITFDGNELFTKDQLFQWMNLHNGHPFSSSILEADIQTLLHQYEKAGYPMAVIRVKDLLRHDTTDEIQVSLQISVDEGKRLTISGLRVEGNTSTKTDVIVREARVHPQELYDGALPERIKNRLMRMQLFQSVTLPELYFDDRDSAGLLVKVSEGNYNSFDGVLGYVPASSSGAKGYITGLVNVAFRNLFGTGRKLSARWFQENANTQEVEFHYLEPWIASLPLNGQFGFFQRKQDSTYIKMQYSVTAEWMLFDEFSLSGSFSQTDVTPSAGYGRTAIASNSSAGLGIAIQYDSRDNILAPTQGVYYSTQYETAKKTVKHKFSSGDSITATTQRVLLDLKYYRTLWFRNILATEFHVRDFRASDIDQSDLFLLGGATTLRGYREGQFLGLRLVWSNIEYRILLAPQSFVFCFFDAGYIVQPSIAALGMKSSEQTKVGYGVGVQVESGIGTIGVSLALGEGDTFSTAKLHIRLMNAF